MKSIADFADNILPRHIIIAIHDTIVMMIAFPLAVLVRNDFQLEAWQIEPLPYGTIIIFFASALVFSSLGLHRRIWSHISGNDLKEIAKAVTIVVMIFVAVMFLFGRMDGVPRGALPILWCLAFAGLCGSRALYSSSKRVGLQDQLPKGHDSDVVRILFVGDRSAAELVLSLLARENAARSEVVGLVAGRYLTGRTLDGIPLMGGVEEIKFILAGLESRGLKPDRIIITSPHDELGLEQVDKLRQEAALANISVDDLPDLIRLTSESKITRKEPQSRTVADVPSTKQKVPSYHVVRRLGDVLCSGITLAFLSPLMAILIIAVRVMAGPPVWFDQRRQGRNMKDFMLHKFRTMLDPITPDGRPLSDDERVTAIGKFLRHTRLDELPQLWNVFVGHMAIIGPRPLLPRDLPDVDEAMMSERFAVRPGITGWAQVNGGKKLTPEQKFALDLYYIRNASLLLDLKIILMTIRMMIFGEEINPVEIRRAQAATA